MWGRERWRRLDRETRLVVLLAVGFVGYRLALASLSGFGFHQGWNEGHYALIARGFLDHPLVPRYAERYVYSVPPLFPYTVAASFLAIGQSVVAARLPSIVASGGLILSTYVLGRTVYEDRRTALVGTVLLATLPYVQLYGGRAQTDALMVCLATAALAAIVRGYDPGASQRWLVGGGVLFAASVAAKQPALLVAAVVLAWLLGNRRLDRETIERTGVLIAASAVFLLPLFAWLALNYTIAPEVFVSTWRHELVGRTRPFANLPLLFAIGLGLGTTPFVLGGALVGVVDELADTYTALTRGVTRGIGPSVLVWWLVLFGAFVLVRTPHGHQYYALVLAPAFALLAARGLSVSAERLAVFIARPRAAVHLALVVIVVLSTLAGTVVLFELSGEFSAAEGGGTHVAADAGEFVANEVPDDATVLVENGYEPPVRWYVRGSFPLERVKAYHVGDLSAERLRETAAATDGPVYVVYPTPSWGDPPTEGVQLTPVHRTETYDYTLMRVVGSVVDTDSKFTFYLNDRGLVVYRVDITGPTDSGSEAAAEVRHGSVEAVP